jgi:cytoskeletal protein RodZ
MVGLGERLRHEREERGLTLAALSAQTKVQIRYLEALEREELKELPGGVFRKGILRAYLGALGVEEALWIPRLEELAAEQARSRGESPAAAEEAWFQFATNVKRNRVKQKRDSRARWLGVLALLMLVTAFAYAFWVFELRFLLRH